MRTDEEFMARALDLAARGRGAVEPNPMVGAVIVRDGQIIGEGWHGFFGGPHAEVEALSAAAAGGNDVRGATMYVTLEPCCHHGKTPPCTDALVKSGLGRVVAAMTDPDAQVSGRGIQALCNAGLAVEVGIREAEARRLLSAYVKLRTRGRPWVICKWAQTADGFLALPDGAGRWVSGEESRRRAHELRGLCDGILVGVETVLADDPLLTNRGGRGRRPVRVVLDDHLRTPSDCRLVRTARDVPVLIATTASGPVVADRSKILSDAGAEVYRAAGREGRVDLEALLDELGRRQWTNLLVEGGAKVLESFIYGRLADEMRVFISPRELGPQGAGLPRFDVAEVRRRLGIQPAECERVGDDALERYILEG